MRFKHNAGEVDSRGMGRAVPRLGCACGRVIACIFVVMGAGTAFPDTSWAWGGSDGAVAQAAKPPSATPDQARPAAPAPPLAQPANVSPPADYIIGPEDVLAIVFWREKDLSAEVVVRPDGMITLPLVNDIKAAGLTPDQLRQVVIEAAGRFVEDPSATIVVKQIHSRRIFITGEVGKPGPYPLSTSMTVLQALSIAGGVADFAKKDRILIMRKVGNQTKTFKFNYKDVLKGINLEQNIELKPGDTIIVP